MRCNRRFTYRTHLLNTVWVVLHVFVWTGHQNGGSLRQKWRHGSHENISWACLVCLLWSEWRRLSWITAFEFLGPSINSFQFRFSTNDCWLFKSPKRIKHRITGGYWAEPFFTHPLFPFLDPCATIWVQSTSFALMIHWLHRKFTNISKKVLFK